MDYILSLDAGTTSNRAFIFNREGEIISMAQKEFTQYFPKPGWVEQDPSEILSTMIGVATEAIVHAGIERSEIRALGITNQRETTILWDRKTGEAVHPAIVWQCRRTAELADELKARGLTEAIHQKTGLVIDAYFSATKIKYILDHTPGLRERANRGEIAFGTVDSYLIYRLTRGKVHATDVSNASRTMLFNINTLDWDEEILDWLDIPRSILPEVRPSSGSFGYAHEDYFGEFIPITGVAGDQQAALFGQACFDVTEAKNTYGTGAFVLMNTGSEPIFSEHGLLTSIGWQLGEEVTYVLEGSIFVAGSAIQWLRDELKFMHDSSESEAMALSVSDTHGVTVVPAFTGLGAPYWNAYARGSIVGLSRGANKNHIVRATLESIALLSRDVIEAMEEDSQLMRSTLKVDGGAANNDFLLQAQADFLNTPVIRPACVETTALGAAYFAGLGSGVYKDLEEIRSLWSVEREFKPQMEDAIRQEKFKEWKRAVNNCIAWAEDKF